MNLTYSFRIKDKNCAKILNQLARSVNMVWNFCNETQLHALKWSKQWPSNYTLHELTAGSYKELGLHAQTIQTVCDQYCISRKQSKKSKLRWRGKRSLGWVPFKKLNIQLKGDCVTYKRHKFRFWKHREIPDKIKCGEFSQDSRGRWYLNLTCDVEHEISAGTGHIGIDLGLKDFATLSTGEKLPIQQEYRKSEERLKYAQRKKRKRQVKSLHAKIRNRRKDWLHKQSKKLIEENELIVVGNVNAKGLAKTRLAKSVLDAGWSTFRHFLEYKAIARKVVYLTINEAFTTQTCSSCSARSGPKGRESLGVREWVCSECNSFHDRDTNAALNILRLGHQSLLAEVQ